MDKIIKKFPTEIKPANQHTSEFIPRIKSGILPFDILTGGGLPIWKINIFHGNYSSGKTTTSLKIIGNFLREYKDKYAVYMDFEDSFDKLWVSNFVDKEDMERLLVVTPDYGEQGIDLAVDLIKEPNTGFLFVDSLAEILPVADIDNSASDDLVGLQARIINKFLRKTLPILIQARKSNRPLATIFINQERAKIGGRVFGEQTKKPGGYFQDFIAAVDIKFYVKQKDSASETKDAEWIDIGFKINKAKVSGVKPFRSGVFRISLTNDKENRIKIGDIISNLPMLTSLAIKNGLITKSGKYYSVGDKITTKVDVEEYLRNNPDEYEKYYNELINFYKEEI